MDRRHQQPRATRDSSRQPLLAAACFVGSIDLGALLIKLYWVNLMLSVGVQIPGILNNNLFDIYRTVLQLGFRVA